MNPTAELLTGVFGLAFVAVAVTCAVVWIVFPFLVMSRLARIDRNTRRLADRLDSANVEINR